MSVANIAFSWPRLSTLPFLLMRTTAPCVGKGRQQTAGGMHGVQARRCSVWGMCSIELYSFYSFMTILTVSGVMTSLADAPRYS